jgi:hypothetical protein
MTQPKIHEDENADHQKGEAMDCRLLAIADVRFSSISQPSSRAFSVAAALAMRVN